MQWLSWLFLRNATYRRNVRYNVCPIKLTTNTNSHDVRAFHQSSNGQELKDVIDAWKSERNSKINCCTLPPWHRTLPDAVAIPSELPPRSERRSRRYIGRCLPGCSQGALGNAVIHWSDAGLWKKVGYGFSKYEDLHPTEVPEHMTASLVQSAWKP